MAATPSGHTRPMSDHDDDRPTPSDLEQLARSLSLDGSVGRRDAQVIADALRRLARIDAGGRGASTVVRCSIGTP